MGVHERERFNNSIFSCIPCAVNEKAVDNKCEVIPEDELEAETDDEVINNTAEDNTASETDNSSSNEASSDETAVADLVDTSSLNCRTSQVIANGVCTYCAVNHVINLGECVPCNVGESNVDNACSDKGISSTDVFWVRVLNFETSLSDLSDVIFRHGIPLYFNFL